MSAALLRTALHRVVDAAVAADDALAEHGAGDQLDDAIATLVRTVERAIAAHAALGSAAP